MVNDIPTYVSGLDEAIIERVAKAIQDADGDFSDGYDKLALAAIQAYHEGMLEAGLARKAFAEINIDADGDTWFANEAWKQGDFPAIILRLTPKEA